LLKINNCKTRTCIRKICDISLVKHLWQNFKSIHFAVAFAPQEVTEDIVVKLIGLWHGSLGRPDQLDRIMCPRHMHLLFNGKTHQQSWLAFKRLLQGLLNANLLSPALVEEQAVGVLQLEWPPSFLEMYSTCINDLVRDAGASSKEGESEDASFTQLLPWLADYCSNLEDLPGE